MKLRVASIALLLLVPGLAAWAQGIAACSGQRVHAYVGHAGALGLDVDPPLAEAAAGQVTVWDSNVADCDGDGVPGDRDGDYDVGIGGGFFGWGPWAEHCGVNVHGPDVFVTDVVLGPIVPFVIGVDDATGFVLDDQGGNTCITDGVISPGVDLEGDDCLAGVYRILGQTCGGGGDGGYWVVLDLLAEADEHVDAAVPSTVGTLAAGHYGAPYKPFTGAGVVHARIVGEPPR